MFHVIVVICISFDCCICFNCFQCCNHLILQEWTSTASQYVEDRSATCKEFLKSEIMKMLDKYQSRSGRWDMEGLKLFLAETIPKGVDMAD